VKHFLDLRWQLAKASSESIADALIAIVIAGAITELLMYVFELAGTRTSPDCHR
jgi:hypothetical protein